MINPALYLLNANIILSDTLREFRRSKGLPETQMADHKCRTFMINPALYSLNANIILSNTLREFRRSKGLPETQMADHKCHN